MRKYHKFKMVRSLSRNLGPPKKIPDTTNIKVKKEDYWDSVIHSPTNEPPALGFGHMEYYNMDDPSAVPDDCAAKGIRAYAPRKMDLFHLIPVNKVLENGEDVVYFKVERNWSLCILLILAVMALTYAIWVIVRNVRRTHQSA